MNPSSRRRSSSRPSSAGRASRSPARRKLPTGWATSMRGSWRRSQSPWRKAATASTCCGCSRSGFSDEGHPHGNSGSPDPRAEGVRGPARFLPGKLQPQDVHGGHRGRCRIRSGQPFALRQERPARSSLPDRSAAGKADSRHVRRGLGCRGGLAQELRHLRQMGGHALERPLQADSVDSTGVRARLCRDFRGCGRAIQDYRLLLAAARACVALERRRGRNPLAGGKSHLERKRQARHAAAPGRSISLRILVTGKEGQVGWELQRSLAGLGDVIATNRREFDLCDSNAIRRTVRKTGPNIIVNAAAYTAVDNAESEPDVAMQVNAIAPGVLAEEAKLLGALLVHYSTDYVFDG